MASKILVKLPVVPFTQRKKSSLDIKSFVNKNDESDETMAHGISNTDKISQLEQNMKFLQEQHQQTLMSLHQEVDTLRQRNRDLQFQLIFRKETASEGSLITAPADQDNSHQKQKASPAVVDVTPPQTGIQEKELQDLKSQVKKSEVQNQQLAKVIESQKKLIENTVKSKARCKLSDAGVQVDTLTQSDLQRRLEDTESQVRRLRRLCEEQSREIAAHKSNSVNSCKTSSTRPRQSPNSSHSCGQPHVHSPEETWQKFPPLQNYWQRNSRGNHSYERNARSDYHRNRLYKEHQNKEYCGELDSTVLPLVQCGRVRVDNSASYPPFHRPRGNFVSENYCKDGLSRKYRGQKSQREYHLNHKD